MKDAILIIENLDLQSLLTMLQKEYNFYYDEKESLYYDYEKNEEHKFLSFLNGEDDISRFYEGATREYIYKTLNNPSFFYVEFKDFSFFKEIILFISNYTKIIVDNDRGHLFEKEELSELEEWIW